MYTLFEPTTQIAQFMGVIILIISLLMVMKRGMTLKIFDDIFKNRGFLYMLGLAEAVLGTFLLTLHWNFSNWPATFVTYLSALLLIEGIMYMAASQKFFRMILKWLHKAQVYYLMTVIYIALGAYLVWIGWMTGVN